MLVRCLVKSITVSSVATVATKQGSKGNTEQWKDERSKDKDEKSEDDGILDGRGIESDGRGSIAADRNVA